jgi:hypothetical protein
MADAMVGNGRTVWLPSPATSLAIRRPRGQRVRALASASRERRGDADKRTLGERAREGWRVGVDTSAAISVDTTCTRGIVGVAEDG